MKNTHLEHPEDSILNDGRTGVKNAIQFLREKNSNLSVKWDGAPAIVFGTNPENGKFFVGTKSVFNKVKVKINYTHHDIEVNHGDKPSVASILHICMEKLPKLYGVYQGDFIGFGGTDTFEPNTVTYKFPQVIDHCIVFAAHTTYDGKTMKEMSASFGTPFYIRENFFDVKFVNTNAHFTSRNRKIDYLLSLADFVSNFVKYPTAKEGQELKVAVNKCIREQRDIAEVGMGKRLTFLYNLIIQIKHLLMENIESKENVQCVFEGVDCDHEGYVMSNQFGAFKLVNRREFSYRNFTKKKSWV
jgi:hypothetical protein